MLSKKLGFSAILALAVSGCESGVIVSRGVISEQKDATTSEPAPQATPTSSTPASPTSSTPVVAPDNSMIVSLGQTVPIAKGVINQGVLAPKQVSQGAVHYAAMPIQPHYGPVEDLVKPIAGEYVVGLLMSDGTFQKSSNPAPVSAYAFPAGTIIKDGDAGLHNGVFADSTGHVWTFGGAWNGAVNLSGAGAVDNYAGALTQIQVDAQGKPFTGLTSVAAGGLYSGALKGAEGTLWLWGDLTGGAAGDGTNGAVVVAPTQVPFPAGVKIKKFAFSDILIALDTVGRVWTWGGKQTQMLGRTGSVLSPEVVANLPADIVDVAPGDHGGYALDSEGQLYGWGSAGAGYKLGLGVGELPAYNEAVALQPYLRLPSPVKSISTNGIATHVILADGSLWGWGDDASGFVGDGQELDFRASAGVAAPYAWDWGQTELMVDHPVRIAPAVSNFKAVYENNNANFSIFAVTTDGYLYSWGRNKSNALLNGIVSANPVSGGIGSTYPNSWDILVPMKINPFEYQNVQVSSPQCAITPTTSPCNQFNLSTNKPN